MSDDNLKVTTNKLYVGDSCYLINNKPNEKYSIVVRNVLKGNWKMSKSKHYFVAAHVNSPYSADDTHAMYECGGSVTVDAGHVCIGSLTKLARMGRDAYVEFVSGEMVSDDGKATFISTDDGRYDVYLARDNDGRVVAIAIVLDYDGCEGCGAYVDDCECCEECESDWCEDEDELE